MIHKDNLVYSTFERFISHKVSADKSNTSYRIGSLSNPVQQGEPDIMWQSVVYILDTMQIWTHGTLMNRTVYIENRLRPVEISYSNWMMLTRDETDFSMLDPEVMYHVYEDEEGSSYDEDTGTLTLAGTYNEESGVLTLSAISYEETTGILTI